MLTIDNYIDAALRQAYYEIIDDEEPYCEVKHEM